MVLLLASAIWNMYAPVVFSMTPCVLEPTDNNPSTYFALSINNPCLISDCLNEIRLHEVVKGDKRTVSLKKQQLDNMSEFISDGYICGVELISSSSRLTATIEGQPIHILEEDDPSLYKDRLNTVPNGQSLSGRLYRYGYFPMVPGDALSLKECLAISVKEHDIDYTLCIRQNGYKYLATFQENLPFHTDKLTFRFFGKNLPEVRRKMTNFNNRIEAICEGIRYVEKAVGEQLVSYVNIMQYNGTDDAFTAWGQDQVWIYTGILDDRTIPELRDIAEHEALHIFVDRHGYTQKTAIRQFFATLHGFRPLSLERFSLVTLGSLPKRTRISAGKEVPFFSFINEKNFIPGMSGGHSGDSLEEFCTSFLHALLYFDQFHKNIQKSQIVLSSDGVIELSALERKSILENFQGALTVFMNQTFDKDSPQSTHFPTNTFESCLDVVKRTSQEFSLVDSNDMAL